MEKKEFSKEDLLEKGKIALERLRQDIEPQKIEVKSNSDNKSCLGTFAFVLMCFVIIITLIL